MHDFHTILLSIHPLYSTPFNLTHPQSWEEQIKDEKQFFRLLWFFLFLSFFFTIFYLTHKAQNKCLFKWSNYLYHMLKNQVRRLSRWLFRFLFFFISTAIHPFKVVYSFSVFSENETFSCRVCEYNLSKTFYWCMIWC